jgi:hypothetical protein
MKKFLIIVFFAVIFSFNFNWVYGEDCQNDISVSSTKECVINKINQIIAKIDRAKNSLKNSKFEYGARYHGGTPFLDKGWSNEYLQYILEKFRENKNNFDKIKNNVIRRIQNNYNNSDLCGKISSDARKRLCFINLFLRDDFKIDYNIGTYFPFLAYDSDNYGGSIVLEDNKSSIFLSITNEGRGILSTKSVATSVLEFLDKFDSFLTYIESYDKIGDKIDSFKQESSCTITLNGPNGIIERINGTTSLDYIRKVDRHIDAFDQTISTSSFLGISFLDAFRLVSEVGIVGAFFGTNSPGVWFDGKYYKVGVYLKNIVPAANTIKNKADNLERAYNVYLDSCTVNFFENGKTLRYNIDAKDLPGEMEKLIRNFSPIITSGYIKVQNIEVPIAVIPPVVWSDEHLGNKTLAAITPERVFNEVRNFVFSLAPFVFTILLLAGALFYLLSPFDIEKIKTGSEYIKWAVFGYFLLLIITSILLALRFIFGGP